VTLITVVFAMTFCLGLVYFGLRDAYHSYIDLTIEMEANVDEITTSINHVIENASNHLELLSDAMVIEEVYAEEEFEILNDAIYFENKDQFHLIVAMNGKESSISGLGNIDLFSMNKKGTLMDAVRLTPYLISTKDNIDNVQWIYFISKEGVINIYPKLSPVDYMFSYETMEKSFYKDVLPENNPDGLTVATEIYEDEAGAGLMTTLSKPVYRGMEFIGSVSIDITLEQVANILKRIGTDDTEYLVINEFNQVIGSSHSELPITEIVSLNELLNQKYLSLNLLEGVENEVVNNQLIVLSEIEEFPWRVVGLKDMMGVRKQLFSSQWSSVILLVMVIAFAALLVRKIRSSQLIYENQLRFARIMNQTVQMMAVLTVRGEFLFVNETIKKIFGVDDEIIGLPIYEEEQWTRNPVLKQFIMNAVKLASEGQTVKEDIVLYDALNNPVNIEFTLNPILNEEGNVVYLVANGKDINDRIKLKESMERLSKFDMLTNVRNRRGITEILDKEISRFRRHQSPFSILLIDIDLFKEVNDTYGHNVGDRVLVELCDTFKEVLRDYDSVARWGGEEFLIILPNTTYDEAIILGQRLNETIYSKSFDSMKRADFNRLSVTIGVSEFVDYINITTLIKQADDALYHGKNTGRNKVIGYRELLKP
jgi:diguanylate cyclase (GGDEF)-like protein/PAS domain S-box-containing protein